MLAITADWATARATSVSGQLPPMYAELDAEPDGTTDGREPAASADAVLDALRRMPETDRPAALAAHLHDIAARVLGLDPGEFGDDENLSNLGIDSLMAVEVKHRVEATLRAEVSVLDLLQGVSVRALAARLLPLLDLDAPEGRTESGTDAGDEEPAETGELAALLAQVPPDELERLLDELEKDQPTEDPTGAVNHDPVA